MKFSDVITLAKQGFTPADIREFMKLDVEQEDKPKEDPQQEPEDKTKKDTQQETKDKTKKDTQQETKDKIKEDPQQETEDKTKEDPEPDYKKLYEEEKAKRQAAARKQEVTVDPEKSVEDTLLDIAKMYI